MCILYVFIILLGLFVVSFLLGYFHIMELKAFLKRTFKPNNMKDCNHEYVMLYDNNSFPIIEKYICDKCGYYFDKVRF